MTRQTRPGLWLLMAEGGRFMHLTDGEIEGSFQGPHGMRQTDIDTTTRFKTLCGLESRITAVYTHVSRTSQCPVCRMRRDGR